MPQALITASGTKADGAPFSGVGSQLDALINTAVQLDNVNIGGELTYTWTILDQPPGTLDNLSSPVIQNPIFTPKKEGTYLIRLLVNQGLSSEQENRIDIAVRQLKTRERIPAAGETTEGDPSDGWATANNSMLRRIDSLLSDPHVTVGKNSSGGARAAGDVVRVTSLQTIKPGLSGEEKVPGFALATAATTAEVDELLGIIERAVDGAASVPANALMQVKLLGTPRAISGVPLTFAGSPLVGDPVFLSDTGVPALVAGTIRRQIGSVAALPSGATYNLWFNGAGGADITPINAPYVVYGAPGTLTNAFRIDGLNATGASGGIPHTFKAIDNATVPLIAKRNSALGTDIQQWQDEAGGNLARLKVGGELVSGELTAAAGTRLVRDTTDPILAQDAATKNYVDVATTTAAARNNVINGNFDFWQRKLSGTVTHNVAAGTEARAYQADRWYGVITDDVVPSSNATVLVERQSALAGQPLSRYFARLTITAAANLGHAGIIQEIDRRWVQLMRGKKVTLSFKWRKDLNSFPVGSPSFAIRVTTGTGAETQIRSGYTGTVVDIINENPVATSVTTSLAAKTVTSTVVVPNDATTMAIFIGAFFNNTIIGHTLDIAEVTLIPGTAALPEFAYAAGSFVGETALVQHYYAKSYDLDTPPTTPTSLGTEQFITNNSNASGTMLRFPVRMRAAPLLSFFRNSTGASNVWDVTGNVVGTTGLLASNISERNAIVDDSGVPNAPDPGDIISGQWTATAEIGDP